MPIIVELKLINIDRVTLLIELGSRCQLRYRFESSWLQELKIKNDFVNSHQFDSTEPLLESAVVLVPKLAIKQRVVDQQGWQ
jgi:hypothetical protein